MNRKMGTWKNLFYLLICKTAEIGPDLQQKQQSLLWFLVWPGSLHSGTELRSKIPLTVISRLTLWFHFQSLTIWALTWYLTWPVYTIYCRLDNMTYSQDRKNVGLTFGNFDFFSQAYGLLNKLTVLIYILYLLLSQKTKPDY